MIADVGGDAPGSVLGEQLGCRAPSRLLLEIDVSERLPTTSRTMKLRLSSLELTSSTEQGGGKRRSGKAQRSCCRSMTLSTIFKCSAIGDPRRDHEAGRPHRPPIGAQDGAFTRVATDTNDAVLTERSDQPKRGGVFRCEVIATGQDLSDVGGDAPSLVAGER